MDAYFMTTMRDIEISKKLIDDAVDYCVSRGSERFFNRDCKHCPGNGEPDFFCGLSNLLLERGIGLGPLDSWETSARVKEDIRELFYQLLDPMQLLIEEVEELDDTHKQTLRQGN
jgi:hypothetical protein